MTTNDTTFRPEEQGRSQVRQREELVREAAPQTAVAQQGLARVGQAVLCPRCGAENEAEAKFCLSCGAALQGGKCPNCGSDVDVDADFCEVCHHYIRMDVCSFCGARMAGEEQFCPQCGSPRGGVICPTCHTLNDFAFCKQCGTPLTDEARALVAKIRETPEYKELKAEVRQLMDLQAELPYRSERDVIRERMNFELRERVLLLLAKDEGVAAPVIPKPLHKRMSADELSEKKEKVTQRITELLNKMAIPPQPSPAKARNYAMAQKPVGARLAWVCNFKHATHSSPCGCAKPQLGGKWVILGKNQNVKIVNDN